MKSSLGKIGRKLTLHKSDVKEMRAYQPSGHLDELAQAWKMQAGEANRKNTISWSSAEAEYIGVAKAVAEARWLRNLLLQLHVPLRQATIDMQDMRNCYDGLLFAAAATANSIYEFSESLNETGKCLLGTTAAASDAESGNVLSTLGNLQLELQKIADTYRSYVTVTITNPTESLLSELLKVEEMKLQCNEKREVYEHMMAQHREKGKLKNGKVESSIAQKLKEAQDEYFEVARLCVFRVRSLKEGQWRSLLTQAARHHAAQLNFFRKGLEAVEAVEPFIRNVSEKHRIDCQLSGLYDHGSLEGEPISGHESTNDDDSISPNPMEVDVLYFQASNSEDSEINQNKHKGEELFGRQTRVGSYSAPLYPDKINASEKLKETQPARKFHSYVLPSPGADTHNPISKPATSVSHSNPLPNSQHDSTSKAALTSKAQSVVKDSNIITPSIQLPTPPTSAGRISSSQRENYYRTDDGKVGKRQSYSGPLTPSKQFSFKIASNSSGPITSDLPHLPSRAPFSQSSLSSNISPPSLSSPKISELHELPRPPSSNVAFSKPVAISGALNRHSAPLLVKNQEISPPNKRVMLTSTCASPLPLPPSVVKFNSSKSGAFT